jgi:ribosomal-protein-alanine N-acetyltransferase
VPGRLTSPLARDSLASTLNELRELETERLVLRGFTESDAPTVARLAGRREIADTTISVPHPCTEKTAREWIASHTSPSGASKQRVFAITIKVDGQLIGSVGFREINPEHNHAEMGCWIGVEWWGQGYATEATRALLQFGFERLNLNRIYAHHMVRNPTSGRVLEKIGMKREGLLRQCVRKWGVFEDVVLLAIVREDWMKNGASSPRLPQA